MIRFERLEHELPELTRQFASAKPFPFVVIDDFCDAAELGKLVDAIPTPEEGGIGKSRDYVFAKNKFEKSNFREIGPLFAEIYSDLMSERFKTALQAIVAAPVWVDPEFHGGGIHQGGEGSFLDMHVDFTHHPLHDDWRRDLNILLYLNPGWEPSHGGKLELRHKATGDATAIEPLFNRLVIMHTRDFTLHGYKALSFPKGKYRRSIATYAYVPSVGEVKGRSTVWYPEDSGMAKRALGRSWPKLVELKGKIFGSATSRNK